MIFFPILRGVVRSISTPRLSTTCLRCQSTQTANVPEKTTDSPEVKKPAEYTNVEALKQFFDDEKHWGEQEVKSGRSWGLDELRIKSNSDLHKLWYVLLKERNMLLTMEQAAKDQIVIMPSAERVDKVEESMKNLEDVVRERNKAYFDLEIGEDSERVTEERVTALGLVSRVRQTEHVMPQRYNTSYNKMYPQPLDNKIQSWFLNHMREKKEARKNYAIAMSEKEVREVLDTYPDVDREELRKKYPSVDLDRILKDVDEKY